MKLLVVEDEVELLNSITEFFKDSGFSCDYAITSNDANKKIEENQYACIVLDIILPDGNGLDIVKKIKEDHIKSGLIIISAKDAIEDKIKGLDLGADDYITKPFSLPELLARVKAVIRRHLFEGDKLIEIGNLTIEPEKHLVKINKKEVKFSKKEYELLLYFASNFNKVISKYSLTEHIWESDSVGDNEYFDFLYSQIKNIKKKLVTHDATCKLETVYGIGYKLVNK